MRWLHGAQLVRHGAEAHTQSRGAMPLPEHVSSTPASPARGRSAAATSDVQFFSPAPRGRSLSPSPSRQRNAASAADAPNYAARAGATDASMHGAVTDESGASARGRRLPAVILLAAPELEHPHVVLRAALCLLVEV